MATLVLVFIALVITVVSAVALRFRGYGNKRDRLPPGSMGWPFVGEYFSFIKLHPTYTRGSFMNDHISKYGKIFSTNLFGKLTIISVDAELNHFILNNDTKLFGPGWPKNFSEVASDINIALVKGEAHKRQRSLMLNNFAGSSLESRIIRDADELASSLISRFEDNSVVSAKETAIKFTFELAMKKSMSTEPGTDASRKLMENFNTLIVGLFAFPLKFPGTSYYRALRAKSNAAEFIKNEIEERKKTNLEQDDLLDSLIKDGNYSANQIADLIVNAVGAAYSSTAGTIPSAIYFLGVCPKALHQLREEHLQLIEQKKQRGGDSKLTWEDCKQLQFTQCVINESLRLGGFLVLPKKAEEDIEFNGCIIPRGSTVIVHLTAMHLDPEIYEEPERFNPWRWMESPDLKKSKNFIPFGRGVRQCPGADLAKLEMTIFLHHLIMKYNWKLVTSDCPVSSRHFGFQGGLPIKLEAW